MAFSSGSGDGAPMAEINVTPLVDVMLVLLIIFMVTAPILSYPIDIDLPQRSSKPADSQDPPPPIRLRIDASGQTYWNDNLVLFSGLRTLMEIEVERDPANQPTLEIDTDDAADYGVLAQVLALARNAQLNKIGFVKK